MMTMGNNLIGTTRIELTDVKTGAREIYENHNMVTNALRDIFMPLGLSNKPNRYFNEFMPYYATLLGGILCFDTELEENPDNYYPPANANLIGCAAYGTQNNTANTFRGGFNQTESEVNLTDRYVKYVYDFATSQANGTIASVCLTHKNGGFTSYGSKNTVYNTSYPLMQSLCEDTLQYVHPDRTGANTSSKYSGMTIGKTEVIFLIDRENDCAYYFKVEDKSHIHITKRRTFLKSVSILDNEYTQKPLIEKLELDELETELSIGYWGYNYDPTNDCLYICTTSNARTEPNQTVLVTEVKMDTWKITQYKVTNTADKNLNTNSSWQFFVTGGYLFLKGYDAPYDVYKFELSNSANVIKLTRTNVGNISGYPKFVINGRIYFEQSNDQLLIADTHTNEIMPPEAQSLFNNSHQINVTPVRNEPLLYFSDLGALRKNLCKQINCDKKR
jgi:hypothetical protein